MFIFRTEQKKTVFNRGKKHTDGTSSFSSSLTELWCLELLWIFQLLFNSSPFCLTYSPMLKSQSGCIIKYKKVQQIYCNISEGTPECSCQPQPSTSLPYRSQVRAVGKRSLISIHRGLGWFDNREIFWSQQLALKF